MLLFSAGCVLFQRELGGFNDGLYADISIADVVQVGKAAYGAAYLKSVDVGVSKFQCVFSPQVTALFSSH